MIKVINENPAMSESLYDGDTVNWNKIKIGDVVGWTIEGVGRLPKVNSQFRIGPFTGTCTKVKDNKVFMKIEGDSREVELNEAVGMKKSEIKSIVDSAKVGQTVITEGKAAYSNTFVKIDDKKFSWLNGDQLADNNGSVGSGRYSIFSPTEVVNMCEFATKKGCTVKLVAKELDVKSLISNATKKSGL